MEHPTLIDWDDEALSVGIAEIDDQHRELVRIINDLHRAVVEHHGREAMNPLLDELFEYTRVHFATEEALMRIFDYPGYAAHKKQHEDLVVQLADIRRQFDEGHGGATFELMQVLRTWLVRHIQHSDRDYSLHFEQSGKTAGRRPGLLGRLFGRG